MRESSSCATSSQPQGEHKKDLSRDSMVLLELSNIASEPEKAIQVSARSGNFACSSQPLPPFQESGSQIELWNSVCLSCHQVS